MPTKISVKDVNFRKYVATEKSGARVLGFAKFTLVVDGIELPYADLKVRVNAKGEHTLCAPSRKYENADGNIRQSSAYRFPDVLYSDLVAYFFAREDVAAALGEREQSDETRLSA